VKKMVSFDWPLQITVSQSNLFYIQTFPLVNKKQQIKPMSDEHEVDHYREALQQQALQQQVLEQQVLEQQALEQQALRQQALQQQQLEQQHLSGQYYNAPPSSLPQHYLQELNRYWAEVTKEIEQTKQFKTHKLPLARIKKIMKSDEDVRVRTCFL
jgi:hypothetical protein